MSIKNTPDIEYATIMTGKELNEFFASIRNSQEKYKSAAQDVLLKNKDILIEAYHNFENKQVNLFYNEEAKLINDQKSWDEKICDACGCKLKIVESYYGDFWGCTNYQNKAYKHRTFPLKYDEFLINRQQSVKVRIDSNWLSEILKQTNLQSSIRASDLLNFYIDYNLDDLREKYGYKNSKYSISGYIRAKKASSTEEKDIANHLSTLFPKSVSQLGIRYKLKKEPGEKKAIIDLILSDDNEINIIEIKRRVFDLNKEQLQKYHSLISFILNTTNDTRVCRALFVVYNSPDDFETNNYKPECNYLEFEKIKNIHNVTIIKNLFNTCCL